MFWEVYLQLKRLGYLFLVLFPFSFLPLIQRRWSTYFLMLPLFLINLLMDWPYQYDIGFQYSYGSVTLLFLMALLSIDQLSKNQLASDNVLVALLASSIIFSSAILYSFTHNWNFEIQYYQTRKDYFDGLEKNLAGHP